MDDSQLKELTGAISSFKETQAKLETEVKESTKASAEDSKKALQTASDLAKDLEKIANRIVDIEQKTQANVMAGKTAPETLGSMVIKSDEFKAFASGSTQRMKISANTIIGQEGSPPQNSDTLVAPQRLPGIITSPQRLLRVSDVILRGVTGSNMVEYVREVAFTNNAAETAEGATKPESSITYELARAPVQTVAHWLKASKQVLEDNSALESYISTRLAYGVDFRIDKQLLQGDGVGQNLSGLLDTGNHTVFTPVTGENALDSINRAIYDIYEADGVPTAIIMNPTDWGGIERIKKGTGDVSYVIGNPSGMLGPTLWGLPVVVTNACPAGKFIVGAFDIAAQRWDRSGVTVEMFEQDDTNVQKNLLTIRAEARVALSVYLPGMITAGNVTL